MTENGRTPPGWYDDGSGTLRWFDGTAWTADVQPAPPTTPTTTSESDSATAASPRMVTTSVAGPTRPAYRRPWVLVTGVVGLVLVLPGVGVAVAMSGSGDNATPAAAPTAVTDFRPSTPAAAAPAAEPEIETATTQQYASLVAGERATLKESSAEYDDCSVTDLTSPSLACGLLPLGISLQAQTLTIKLEGATDGLRAIGDPPAEIAQLVADTKADLAAVIEAADAVDCSTSGCEGWEALSFPLSSLMSDLDAWDPYT